MWVLRAVPRQEPHDIGTDASGRRIYVFMVECYHEAESGERNPGAFAVIGARLRRELDLEPGKTYFLGRRAEVDAGAEDPYLRITETEGLPADMTHQDMLRFRRSSMQVVVIGKDERETVRLAHRAHDLCAVANEALYADD